MTIEESTDAMGRMLRDVLSSARHNLTDRGEDPLDRVMAAAALAVAAGMFVWPTGRKLPKYAALGLDVGRRVWARRDMWAAES